MVKALVEHRTNYSIIKYFLFPNWIKVVFSYQSMSFIHLYHYSRFLWPSKKYKSKSVVLSGLLSP